MSIKRFFLVCSVAAGLCIAGCTSNPVSVNNTNGNEQTAELLPDLIISSMVITSMSSSRIEYQVTIKNIGTQSIPDIYNIVIQNKFSNDTIFGNSDDVPGGGSMLLVHRSLIVNGAYTFNFVANMFRRQTMEYLIPKIDYNNRITEVFESNNTRWANIN